jgi:hypothetical protein
MALTVSITARGYMPSGEAYVHGTATFDSLYATGGETLNLSSYMQGAAYPSVHCIPDDGYVPAHDRGTATAGKIKLYRGGIANAVLSEATVNTNAAAVVIGFLAIGAPHI